jgi:triosephosphate isomerase
MKLIVANWKMNPEKIAEAKALFSGIKRASGKYKKTKVVVCVPSVYLAQFSKKTGTHFFLGAQDTFYLNKGSFTGAVSPQMLRDIGVTHVIVGHSERRSLGETNELVSKKTRAVIESGMTAIVCIGEKERDAKGKYLMWLENQIKDSLSGIGKKHLKKLLIAYEPIWAIGKTASESVTPVELHQMSIFVHKILTKVYGKKSGLSIPVLYGGSVEPDNARSLIDEVDGYLVGHASLDIKQFGLILEALEKK